MLFKETEYFDKLLPSSSLTRVSVSLGQKLLEQLAHVVLNVVKVLKVGV